MGGTGSAAGGYCGAERESVLMMRINIPGVVPANAGTHTPRIFDSNAVLQQPPLSYAHLGLWVPAFAGTTLRGRVER